MPKFIVSRCWGPESKIKVGAELVPSAHVRENLFRASPPASAGGRWCSLAHISLSSSSHGILPVHMCLCVFPSYKDVSRIKSGPTLMGPTLMAFLTLPAVTLSKQCHILRSWRIRTSTYEFVICPPHMKWGDTVQLFTASHCIIPFIRSVPYTHGNRKQVKGCQGLRGENGSNFLMGTGFPFRVMKMF